jgi:class 3 adenylate cyclase
MVDDPREPAAPTLERKLVTILSADVAGYSALMAEDEEQTLRTFREHSRIFESLVTLHRGRVFNTAGDAILAEFPSAVEAVRCATEIQGALRTRNDQLPPARQVQFRIGINLGDVIVQNNDLLGDGVNVAARLQAAAEPGGICVSGSVYDQIRNKLSLTFASLGERSFKNIPQPVRTFSITGADGHATLPSPKIALRGGRAALRYGAAAIALLLLIAGGFWVFAMRQPNQLEQGHAGAHPPAQPGAGAVSTTPLPVSPPLATAPAAAPLAAPPAIAVVPPAATTPPVALVPVSAAGLDGLYAGSVCFDKSADFPAACIHGEATLSHGGISGQWPGPKAGITWFISGVVVAAGEAKIDLHSQKKDGQRIATIDLTGTVRDGHLDATGHFLNGRAATLHWQKI